MEKKDFKLNYIYYAERNHGFRNMQILQSFLIRHYKLTEEEANKIKIQIVNYQVERYGETLARTNRKGIMDKCVR